MASPVLQLLDTNIGSFIIRGGYPGVDARLVSAALTASRALTALHSR